MAHKTKVNGTNYEVSGGKTLVNGTAYKIDKGKTLVNGTSYLVSFAPPDPQISIVVNPVIIDVLTTSGQITINGTTYKSNSTNTTLTIPVGTVISCKCGATTFKTSTASATGVVSVNGTTVAQTTAAADPNKYINSTSNNYDYTVTRNATIELTGTLYSSDAVSSDVIITEH